MGYNIDVLIRVAQEEVGYCEKDTNENLESKLPSGRNNFTKYGAARGCNGQPWCDAFVDWCFMRAYGDFTAKSLLCGFSNYTPTSADYFKKRGLFATCKPKAGDVIFFKNSARICHTGIVIRTTSDRVYTIEGNTSGGSTLVSNGGCVAEKSYPLNYNRIAGYGRPNYTQTETPTLYKGCKGPVVRKLQQKLNELYPYGKVIEDGDFGPATMNKLCEVQSMLGLQHDAICGPKTWMALLR